MMKVANRALATDLTEPEALAISRVVWGHSHVSNNTGDNEWYTPKEYIDLARQAMGSIDLDPASNDHAQQIVQANTYYTQDDDGLAQEWAGNVWLNPPYEKSLVSQFTDKLIASPRVGHYTVLVNNATDTAWFQRLANNATAICLVAGRVQFYHGSDKGSSPLQGQVVLYRGDVNKFLRYFDGAGSCWCRST